MKKIITALLIFFALSNIALADCPKYGTLKFCPTCKFKIGNTGSMQPTLNETSSLTIDKINRSYVVGDIVVYRSKAINSWVIHRIVSLEPLTTKGDNNVYNDVPIKKIQIIGKVCKNG